MLLNRDQILSADDLTYKDVEVPEWGGVVRVRVMTGAERGDFEQSIITGRGKNRDINFKNLRGKLVARCLIDEDGERLFSDADIQALEEKSAAALSRVFDVCQRINGLTDSDVEELTENFSTTRNGASISD